MTSLSLFTFMHWRKKWQPTPVFLPGESQGWGSLVGCRLWGRTESDTTEVTQQQQQHAACMTQRVKRLPARWKTWVRSLRPRFDPWVRQIPWRRKWQPTPVLLPGKSHGQRSLVGCSPWGRKESNMTEQLHFHFSSVWAFIEVL